MTNSDYQYSEVECMNINFCIMVIFLLQLQGLIHMSLPPCPLHLSFNTLSYSQQVVNLTCLTS